ncbi:hypothetical protein DRN58_01205 [Thermococci archaeon]|nr:MAG: hypothetical protein DRN58_01205 [Thermococci archaeon]
MNMLALYVVIDREKNKHVHVIESYRDDEALDILEQYNINLKDIELIHEKEADKLKKLLLNNVADDIDKDMKETLAEAIDITAYKKEIIVREDTTVKIIVITDERKEKIKLGEMEYDSDRKQGK